jgi:hypothetical protein
MLDILRTLSNTLLGKIEYPRANNEAALGMRRGWGRALRKCDSIIYISPLADLYKSVGFHHRNSRILLL